MSAGSASASEGQAAAAARRIALQMLEERGRGAVLVGVARVDASLERVLQALLLPSPSSRDALFQPDRPVERALQTLRRVRNTFAHSSESAALSDPAHAGAQAEAYREAHANPLWAPLQEALDNARTFWRHAPPSCALQDYILLIMILVAFRKANAWGSPDSVDTDQEFTGVSVRAAMHACS